VGGGDPAVEFARDAPWPAHAEEDQDATTLDRGDYGPGARPSPTAEVVCSCGGRLHRVARDRVGGDPVTKVLIEGAPEHLDREGTIRTLRELADEVESGYVAAFKVKLEPSGVGTIWKTTAEERHPLAPAFEVGNADPVTPATAPGKRKG
jgi:hypothetical protein